MHVADHSSLDQEATRKKQIRGVAQLLVPLGLGIFSPAHCGCDCAWTLRV